MKKIILLLLISITHYSFTPKELTWVAIGDSITYLNDHQDETGNRITKGYMTRVVEKLPNIQYINKGFNGWTATNIAHEIEKLGIPKADVYSVFLGTNDWWSGKPIGSFKDYEGNTGTGTIYGAFRVIIDKLHSLNKKATIILITPMQRVDFVYVNDFENNAYGSYREKDGQQLEAVANAIVDIAKHEKVRLVDLYHKKGMDHSKLVDFKWLRNPSTGAYKKYKYPDFIDVPFNTATDEYPYPKKSMQLTYDGLHPSDKGYQRIAKELIREFKKIK
jgi:lysophospholipase L1-like esterase